MYLTQLKRFIFDFGVSGSAAIVSKTLIAPVERAKFILQNQDYALDILTGKQKPYNGLMDLLKRVPREQGILSLWRGNGANLARYFPSQALNFSLYQYYKNFFVSCVHSRNYSHMLSCKLIAGALAGSCSAAIVFPLDFCQTRLALDMGHGKVYRRRNKPREFNGILSCFHKIVKKDGIRGVYKGVFLSMLGFGIYRAFYFALYDLSKAIYSDKRMKANELHEESEMKLPLVLSLLSAQMCTILAAMVSYPLDTITRHMMLDSGRPQELRQNTSATVTGKQIWEKYGIYGFYRGAFVNILRCTAGALVLVMYDEIVYYTDAWTTQK